MSLATKYRPRDFEDLVGQLAASQSVKNALEFRKIGHAYLFHGARGVGEGDPDLVYFSGLKKLIDDFDARAQESRVVQSFVHGVFGAAPEPVAIRRVA